MPTEATIADLRVALETERDELRSRLVELGFGDSAGLDYDANFADTSQVTAERGEAEALANTLRETLQEVEHALSKVGQGSFGACERCENEISAARLEAMPSSRFCIDCASGR